MTFDTLCKKIERYIELSRNSLDDFEIPPEDDSHLSIPVMKYFASKYLESFLYNQAFVISRTEGFTWGDGVYVTPLKYAQSAIIYGRCGSIGWYKPEKSLRVFDAAKVEGIELYQQWLRYNVRLYKLLTTTVHSSYANRQLRNRFKKMYNIDLVIFRPDEKSPEYTTDDDVWFAISDVSESSSSKVTYSDKIKDCEWILVSVDEFERSGSGFRSLLEKYFPFKPEIPVFSISMKEFSFYIFTATETSFEDVCEAVYNTDTFLVVIP